MAWQAVWDEGFIVGGSPKLKLTPNFRLKEFQNTSGEVRVHRELVSALQIVRSELKQSIKIKAVAEDGLAATLSVASLASLLSTIQQLSDLSLFSSVEPFEDQVSVRVSKPEDRQEIHLTEGLHTAFAVTSGFETSGDPYQQVTGNFDGAGLSFGPLQWNFKTATLTKLFDEFYKADTAAVEACFTDEIDHQEWQMILTSSIEEQIEWANNISTGAGAHDVQQPWKAYLQAVGQQTVFRDIMFQEGLKKYGERLLKEVLYLKGLTPTIEIDHLRCLCALFDLVVQQGSLHKAKSRIEQRIKTEQPQDQFELLSLVVSERARMANPRWRSDCESRRLGILHGVPTTVEERQRANWNFYLLRDVHIANVSQFLNTGDLQTVMSGVQSELDNIDSVVG